MTFRFAPAAAVAALVLSACSTGPDGTGTVTLQVSGRSFAGSGPALAAEDTVEVGGSTLIVQSVELVARQVRLRKAGDECADPAADPAATDDAECATVRVDASLLNVPLGEDAAEAFGGEVEAGSYDRIQFQIHKPTASTNDAAFLAANPDWAGLSVKVTGTFDGNPFTYTADFTAVETVNLDEPLEVTDGGEVALTLHLDVSGWFLNGGVLIDPTSALSQQLKSRIEQNIRASFRAFQDEDQDGAPA